MGTLLTTSTMIKLLLGSALPALSVAVGYYGHPHFGYYGKRSADAEPEADADAYYGYYGYGGYRGYRGYYGYPYGYRYYGKRSADAEPAVLAGASRVISAPTPLIHNPPVLPHVAYAAHPLAYAGYAAHPLAYHGLPVLAAPGAAEWSRPALRWSALRGCPRRPCSRRCRGSRSR